MRPAGRAPRRGVGSEAPVVMKGEAMECRVVMGSGGGFLLNRKTVGESFTPRMHQIAVAEILADGADIDVARGIRPAVTVTGHAIAITTSALFPLPGLPPDPPPFRECQFPINAAISRRSLLVRVGDAGMIRGAPGAVNTPIPFLAGQLKKHVPGTSKDSEIPSFFFCEEAGAPFSGVAQAGASVCQIAPAPISSQPKKRNQLPDALACDAVQISNFLERFPVTVEIGHPL